MKDKPTHFSNYSNLLTLRSRYWHRESPRSRWRHQMETFSALVALWAGNSPVTGEFPNKGQWRGALMFPLICAWINVGANNRKTPSRSLWRRRNVYFLVSVLAEPLDKAEIIGLTVLGASVFLIIVFALLCARRCPYRIGTGEKLQRTTSSGDCNKNYGKAAVLQHEPVYTITGPPYPNAEFKKDGGNGPQQTTEQPPPYSENSWIIWSAAASHLPHTICTWFCFALFCCVCNLIAFSGTVTRWGGGGGKKCLPKTQAHIWKAINEIRLNTF